MIVVKMVTLEAIIIFISLLYAINDAISRYVVVVGDGSSLLVVVVTPPYHDSPSSGVSSSGMIIVPLRPIPTLYIIILR